MKTLALKRHGQAEFNRLTDVGIQQTREFVNDLLPILEGQEKIGLYSSDIERAKQTAQIIGEVLNFQKDIRYSHALRQSYGKGYLEGIGKYLSDEFNAVICVTHQPNLGILERGLTDIEGVTKDSDHKWVEHEAAIFNFEHDKWQPTNNNINLPPRRLSLLARIVRKIG